MFCILKMYRTIEFPKRRKRTTTQNPIDDYFDGFQEDRGVNNEKIKDEYYRPRCPPSQYVELVKKNLS
jgi:hypothetical protein